MVQSCFIMITNASGLYGSSAGCVNSHGVCPQAAGQPKFARRRAGESGPAGASTGVGGPVDALLPVSPQSHSRSGELMLGVDGWEAFGVGGTDEVGSSAAAAAYFSKQARCAPCPQPGQNRCVLSIGQWLKSKRKRTSSAKRPGPAAPGERAHQTQHRNVGA